MNIKQLMRKINNFFARGKLLDMDLTPKVPTAKVGLMADEVMDSLEFPQTYGFKSAPPKTDTAEVITAHFGGNRNHGTILKIFDRKLMPNDLNEGDVTLYGLHNERIMIDADGNILLNNANIAITLDNDGSMTLASNTTIKLDAPTVTIEGNLQINGDLVTTGTINGVTIG